ncbi:hypothetical protein FBU59_002666, partial [Linderina macrospora]
LNARIGKLGVSLPHAARTALVASAPVEETAEAEAEAVQDDVDDPQYDRIQQMIDSLISEANSAIEAKPAVASDHELGSDFPEPAFYTKKRATRAKPRLAVDCSPELLTRRPSSAQGVRVRRHRRARAAPAGTSSSGDPTEADGESDLQQPLRGYRRGMRRRADTGDSVLSNSSETCVPSDVLSRSSRRSSLASSARVNALCTPSRATFSEHGVEREFPQLDSMSGGHRRSVSRDDGVPLMRRFRNSVTRAALMSASLVDGSVTDEIAEHARAARTRSSTTVSEISTTFVPLTRWDHPDHAADEVSALADSFRDDASVSPGARWSLDVARSSIDIDAGQRRHYPVRTPDAIEEYDSTAEAEAAAVAHRASAAAATTSPSALVGMASLLYWTLLFTLGALMLDSFLCQVAGKRVMNSVDRIAQIEGVEPESDDDSPNVGNTVGRFVRWYIEGTDDHPAPASLGIAASQNRSLRQRKPSAMRGSFRYVE